MRVLGAVLGAGLVVLSLGSSPAWAIGFELVCLPAVDETLLFDVADAVDAALENLESEDKCSSADAEVLAELQLGTILGGPLIGTATDWTWETPTGIGLCVVEDRHGRTLLIQPDLEDGDVRGIINLSLGWHPE